MIQGNFTGDGTVVTDGLYRYDEGQVLKIYNTGLTVAPAVHFANKKSTEALVVQSSLSSEVVSVDIPNELLQYPYEILAYIYTSDGSAGTTIDKIRIPVIDRPIPADYVYTDNVSTVTYAKLATEIVTYYNKAVTQIETVEDLVEAEAEARETADADLQSQINAIVVAATDDGGDASVEVAQARVDPNGTTYDTLKERLNALGIYVGDDDGIYQLEDDD